MNELLNKILRITGYRGESRDRYAKVVNVRDIYQYPIIHRQYKRRIIPRSRYLITVQDIERNEYRSYYSDYVVYSPLEGGA